MPAAATGKRRRASGADSVTVAVLVEDSNNELPDTLIRGKKVRTVLVAADSLNDPTGDIRSASSPRKRPGGSAAIPRARVDSMGHKPDQKTTDLHEALQRYATDATSEEIHNRTKLADTDYEIPVAGVGLHRNDDMDYVYDTYIRYSGGPRASSSMDTMAAAAEGSVGFLVLTQEDQELWHIYQEDDAESEPDWDSEQDDENGTRSKSTQRMHALMKKQRRTTTAPTTPRTRSLQMTNTATAHTSIGKGMARTRSTARATTTTGATRATRIGFLGNISCTRRWRGVTRTMIRMRMMM